MWGRRSTGRILAFAGAGALGSLVLVTGSPAIAAATPLRHGSTSQPDTPGATGPEITPLPLPPQTRRDQPQPLTVSSRESVHASLDATGSQLDTRLYTHLTVWGHGRYRIVDPSSTEGLRSLSGFAAPNTYAGAAVWNLQVNGITQRRTVAEFTKTLPISIRVRYELDGQPLTPQSLVGRSGHLRVTYEVLNETSRPTRLTFQDGEGRIVEETVDVATPYVGQLRTNLPSEFSQVAAPRGDVVADGRGNSEVTWSLVLFEPIGEVRQRLTYTARVTNVELPPARAEFVPIPPQRQPEFRFGQEGFAAGVDSGRALSQGALELHSNVINLREGASTVLSGMSLLQQQASGLGSRLTTLRQQLTGLTGQLDTQLTPNSQSLAARALQVEAEARALSLLVASPYNVQAQRLAAAAAQLAVDARGVADTAGRAGSSADSLGRGLDAAAGGSAGLVDGLGRTSTRQQQLVDGATAISARGAAGLLGNSRAAVQDSARNLAVMQELNRRAARDGQPYGPPAVSNSDSAAYVYTLAGETHDPVDNGRRALAASGMLLLGTLVATLARHRIVPWPPPWPWSRQTRGDSR